MIPIITSNVAMKKQNGFSLIEVILSLVVLGYISVKVPAMYSAANKESKQNTAATQMQRFSKALNSYQQTNSAALLGTATAVAPATVTVAMLISTGDLPAGFSGTNSYGATLQGQFLQPNAGVLRGVAMTVGGNDPGELDAGTMAAKLGAKGGRITATGAAVGAYGGWNLPMTGFTNPGTNRLVSYLNMDTGAGSAADSDALRRHAVAGHPEYNSMYTAINANNNDINAANNVGAQKVTLASNKTLQSANSTYGALTVQGDKNTYSGINFKNSAGNNSGTLMMNPQYSGFLNAADNNWRMYVDDVGNSVQPGSANIGGAVTTQYLSDSNNTGYYLDPNNGNRLNYVVSDNTYTYGTDTSGAVYTQYMVDTNNGGYYLDPNNGNRLNYVDANNIHTYGTMVADGTITPGWAVETWGCSPNGAIGKAAYAISEGWAYSGTTLSCVNGVWKKAGGGGINFAATHYVYVGDGGRCPANEVVVGVGGFYATYTAGYLYCAPAT